MRNDIKRIADALGLRATSPEDMLEKVEALIESDSEFRAGIKGEDESLERLKKERERLLDIIEVDSLQRELARFTLLEKKKKKDLQEATSYFINELYEIVKKSSAKVSTSSALIACLDDKFIDAILDTCKLDIEPTIKRMAYFKALDSVKRLFSSYLREESISRQIKIRNKQIKSFNNLEKVGFINAILKMVK